MLPISSDVAIPIATGQRERSFKTHNGQFALSERESKSVDVKAILAIFSLWFYM